MDPLCLPSPYRFDPGVWLDTASLCSCQYYATVEHASNAWFGIIHKIAPLLGPLRAPPPIVGSDEDRARRSQAVKVSFIAGCTCSSHSDEGQGVGLRRAHMRPAFLEVWYRLWGRMRTG